MKIIRTELMGTNKGFSFFYNHAPQCLVSISILDKKESSEYATLTNEVDRLKFVVSRTKVTVMHGRRGYWSAWLVAIFKDLISPKDGILFVMNGNETIYNYAFGSGIPYTDWWKMFERQSALKGGNWVIKDTRATTATKRDSAETAMIVARLNTMATPGAKLLAKTDRRNGNILLSIDTTIRLNKK